MGKYDSSIYRVRPLMEYIEGSDVAFGSLLSLVGIEPLGKPKIYRYNGEECKEMQLKPTKKHLMALIDIMAIKDHTGASVKGEKRCALFFGNAREREDACKMAKRELEEKYGDLTPSSRSWYVFEGFTNPDIFIEGDDYVIVCEGKWTEPHITTTTTHLSGAGEYRNQMIRHIQGALNYTRDTGKRVYAFYIVDGECGYLDDLTGESLARQLELETVKLSADEKRTISETFFGYTTWQDIEKKLPGIVFKSQKDII